MPPSNTQADQHYVPQLLLRGFAAGKRKQIYVFDKSSGEAFRSSIRNVACERDFYRLDNRDDPNRVDKWLGDLETTTAPIIRSICTRRTVCHLKPTERHWLAAFIAIQHIRTRQYREQTADLNKQLADVIRQTGTEPNSLKNFREFTTSENREFAIGDVQRLGFKLLPYILNKSWILLCAGQGAEFWIGDNPVVLANNLNPGDGVRGTLGFGVYGIEIYLPISGDLTLGCMCPTIPAALYAAQRHPKRSEFKTPPRTDEFLNAFSGSVPMRLDAENVTYHNSLQAASAERFVFCSHGNFDLLREMLTINPNLRAGRRVEIVGRSRRARNGE